MVATMTNTPLTDERIVQFRLHNATIPRVSRLPYELLSAIFVFAMSPICIPTDGRPVDDLFALSSVSSYWRDIAIHTPILWADALKHFEENSYIYFDKITDPVISTMDLLATRAQDLPISWNIYVMDNLPDYPWLPFLDKHKHHLGELYILADVLSAAQILTHFTQPMPLLETLGVSLHRGGTIRLSLPPDLFGRSAPNLKELELRDVNLPSPDFTATTFFNVRHMNMGRSDRHSAADRDVTVSRVLETLAAMPNLEEIIFFLRVLPDDLSSQPRSLKPVFLKDLRSFRLDYVDCRIFSSFMKSLSLPSLERLDLSIDLTEAITDSDILRVLCHQLLEEHAGTPLFSRPFEYVNISFRNTTITVKVGAVSENKDAMELSITAYFPNGADSVLLGHALKNICCSLPLDQVRTLLVKAGGNCFLPEEDDPDDVVVRAWSEACAGMKSIEVAKVENLHIKTNRRALHSAILRIVALKEN